MANLHAFVSGVSLAVALSLPSLSCSTEEKSKPTGHLVENILQTHRIGAWDLDLSNLQKLSKDPDEFLKEMSGQLSVHPVSRPPAQDAYIYDILIDEDNRRFWIQRRGGYGGVNEVYGVGLFEPDGSIKYVDPTALGYPE